MALVGKMLCNICEKDCTGGLYAFVMAIRGTLNEKQQAQFEEFKKEFKMERFVICWNCMAKAFFVNGTMPKKLEKSFSKLDLRIKNLEEYVTSGKKPETKEEVEISGE